MTDFAIIYDIITVGLLIGMLFAGFKRGFASAVVSLAAIVVAFACAMLFSGPIADAVYKSYAEQPIEQSVSSVIDDSVGAITLSSLSDVDYSAIRVNDVAVEDIVLDYGGQNKVVMNLSDVDLSGSGITVSDLVDFGVSEDTDLHSVSGKTAEFTRTDVERYGLGRMIVAQIIACNIRNSSYFSEIAEFAQNVGEAVPLLFGGMGDEIADGKAPAVRSVVLIMMASSASFKDAVINGMIEPCVKLLVQTLAFVIIFSVVMIVLNLLSRLLKFVNKIPVIGGLNSFCGGLVGLVEGVFTVFVVCIIVRLITVLCSGTIMLFNEAEINSTYVFSVFYNFDFLNFISDLKIG